MSSIRVNVPGQQCSYFQPSRDRVMKCLAFPHGIPERFTRGVEFLGDPSAFHDHVEPDQVGTYTYTLKYKKEA